MHYQRNFKRKKNNAYLSINDVRTWPHGESPEIYNLLES